MKNTTKASRDYQERKEVVTKNWERLLTNKHWWGDNRQPLVGTLVIIASIFFAWGFSEIVPSPWTQAVGQFYWAFSAVVLFNVVGFLIILKIEKRKKSTDEPNP